jgi:hypothetical protein
MKKNILLFLLTISVCSYSQLLWQITGKCVKSPSFLLGTHSLIPAKALDSVPGVYRAFNKCNVVISRYNVYTSEANDLIKKAAFLPLSKSIKNYLSDSSYTNTDIELKRVLKIGLKETALMHPAVIRQMYLSELFNIAVNLSDDAQTDSYFQHVADIKGFTVIGLENYTNYLNTVYDPAKIQEHATKLAHDVTIAESYKADFVKLMQLYRNGNLQNLNNFLTTFTEKIDVVKMQKNFSEGNTEKLKELLNSNSCFITTDISQLEGTNGLIAQLRKAGYDVKPYPSTK